MPLYEFRCPNGHDFEKFFRSIGTSSSEAECPVCGAVAQRVMSAAGLVFKGSGFYITDYGKDGKKAEREAASAAKEKAGAATAVPSEAGAPPSGGKSAEPTASQKSKSEPTPKVEASNKAAPSKPSASSKTAE
ncbi:MAG TPA: zinc ribbon domain-containing protein [Gemmatimonadaceae bacterium]